MDKNSIFERTVNELKDLPENHLEEVYEFIKYLKYKSARKIDWKIGFKEALDKMNEISSEHGLTEKDIEEAIDTVRKGKL